MANVFDSLKERFFPKDNYDEYYDEGLDEEYEEYEEEPAPKPAGGTGRRYTSSRYGSNSRVYKVNTNVQMEVLVCSPTSIDEIGEACDALKENKTVVVNLERVNLETAQRISDFLSGASFVLDGNIQPISNEILIIGPTNVDITGNFAEELEANGINIARTSSTRWK